MPLLPKAAKTFLNTNGVRYKIRSFDVIDHLDGSEQAYLGIAVFLRQIINIRLHNERVLDLLFNIDGLLLYKSSSKQFWPILCKVFFDPDIYKPLPVAIYASKLLKLIIYTFVPRNGNRNLASKTFFNFKFLNFVIISFISCMSA